MKILPLNHKDKLVIRTTGGAHIISCNDIVFVKADNNYSKIYLTNKKELLACNTLKHIESILKSSGFVRCHKSYLVNIESVIELCCSIPAKLLLKNNYEIPVSREGLKRIKLIFGI